MSRTTTRSEVRSSTTSTFAVQARPSRPLALMTIRRPTRAPGNNWGASWTAPQESSSFSLPSGSTAGTSPPFPTLDPRAGGRDPPPVSSESERRSLANHSSQLLPIPDPCSHHLEVPAATAPRPRRKCVCKTPTVRRSSPSRLCYWRPAKGLDRYSPRSARGTSP